MLSQNISTIIISLLAFIIALTIHEFSHALVAYLLGDDTAKKMGRLTLNPLSHIDPLGLLFLVIFRVGWAKPVPMDQRNFNHPRVYAVIAALAGPISNFVLAFIALLIFHYTPAHSHPVLREFLTLSVVLNVMLGVFNLIPFPPLDGSHIIAALVPQRYLYQYYQFQRIAFFILLLIIMLPPFQRFLLHAVTTIVQMMENLIA